MWKTADWGSEGSEIRQLFKKQLAGLNQVYLYDAIDNVKCKYSWHQPELQWFLKEYELIENKRLSSNPRPQKPEESRYGVIDKWFVDWEQPSKGRPDLMYKFSCDCPDKESAIRHARKVNGRIRNFLDISSESTSFDLINEIIKFSELEIQTAINHLVLEKIITIVPSTSNYSSWNNYQIGVVLQRLENKKD